MADATVKRTGVIGLGAMGLQMARHMVRKGFEVAGYDVDSEAAKKAASHGVRVCGSVAEVAKHAEVVMVPEAGHYPHSQRPDVTTQAIVRFLEALNTHA